MGHKVQHVVIELLRILQEGKVADFQPSAAGPRQEFCAAMNSVFSRLIASSWSASTIQVGVLMAPSCALVKFGWVAHILEIWSRKLLYSVGVAESP